MKRTWIKNARIVNEGKIFHGSIVIENEVIAEVLAEETVPSQPCGEIIDAKGYYLMPGVIDDHVHFRDPGLTHKADIHTESTAAAAGGVTSFMDMPNTTPQTTTLEALNAKFADAATKSIVNYSFYFGATNTNADVLPTLDKSRVCGVKLFMGASTGNMLVDRMEVLRKVFANAGMLIAAHCEAARTYDYARYMNTQTVPEIVRAATAYRNAISSAANAHELMRKGGFDFDQFRAWGFEQDENGLWKQRALGQNATDAQRIDNIAHRKLAHTTLVKFFSSLRQTFGGSAEAAENILRVAGFTPDQYGNEPDSNDTRPFAANPITNTHLDDGGAGGNYSGTGRLSSAAPKQVIVNIESLLSVRTIDLMKSKEGQTEEIQNLKEQLAQALIDVVHDFDASWNA